MMFECSCQFGRRIRCISKATKNGGFLLVPVVMVVLFIIWYLFTVVIFARQKKHVLPTGEPHT